MTLATPLPTLLKVVGWSQPILIFIEIFVWVAEYSAKKQMLSYQEVSIIWLVGFMLVSFASFLLSCPLKKRPPHFSIQVWNLILPSVALCYATAN